MDWISFLGNTSFMPNAEIPIRSLKYTNTKSVERLGDLYRTGEEGIEKDLYKALEWYKEGAENGGTQSMAWLTYIYKGGQGVDQDLTKAVKWAEKGAGAGHDYCMMILGELYRTGEGVKKNPKKALEWYKKGAKAGRTACRKAQGDMYRTGEDVKQDPKKALKLYKKGAKQGDGNCRGALGDLYRTGEEGIEKNPYKALKWYKEGAEAGHLYCMAWVTCMYRGKQGIEADLKEAMKWAQKGAEKGSEYCINALTDMSSDDIQESSAVIEGKSGPIQFDLQPMGGSRTGRAAGMAQKIEREGRQIKVTTDNNASASYQLESETFPVNPEETIHVHFNITVEEGGIIALGLLDTSMCNWYGLEVLLKAGHHEDSFERIVPSGESKASLVVRNYHLGTPGQSTFTIDEIGLYKK
jgi:TPR repeat protein